MEDQLKFYDKSGREVTAGDYIVYGHALGRCAGLRYGKVLEVVLGKNHEYWQKEKEIPKLKIWGINDDWNCMNLLSKSSVVQFPARILKITEDQMPKEAVSLLQGLSL